MVGRTPASATVRVWLCGEWDVGVQGRLDRMLRQVHGSAEGALVVSDWTYLVLLSAGCARTMVAAEAQFRERGGRAVVVHVPAQVERYLRVAGLEGAFEILDPAPSDATPAGGTMEATRAAAIRFEGVMTASMLRVMRRRVRDAADHGHRDVVVDVGAVTVDGRQQMISFCATVGELARLGGRLELVGVKAELTRILRLCAFPGVAVSERRG